MPELDIKLTDGRTMKHTLGDRAETIGRDRSCEIFVDDPSTSRQHARFTPTSRGFLVEDLGSKNGTLVNQRPTRSQVVHDGDRITIGTVEVIYHDAASAGRDSVVVEDDDFASTRATRYVSQERKLLLSHQRLQMIYELSDRLTRLRDREELLEDVLSVCFEALYFERGAVGVRGPGQRTVDWTVVRNLSTTDGDMKISGSLVRRALDHGERAIFSDAGKDAGDPTLSIVQHGIRSAMCVPLAHHDEVLGVIYGDRTSTSAEYTKEDIDFLAAIARQASIGLINARHAEEQKKLAQLQHDLDLARQIQTELLPAHMPAEPEFEVAALNDPGNRVSGDYYDVIETGDGRYWLLIADVTGEGVPASLLMANLQAAVRVTIADTDEPGELLTRWNRLICANTDSSKFITCLLALIDPERRSIRFASAGHHMPLIITPGAKSLQRLEGAPGFPLGVEPDCTFPTTEHVLEAPRGMFLIYTDGVIEARNPQGTEFGEDALHATLAAHDARDPQSAVDQVRQAVAQFAAGAPQSDDITILAARIGQ